MNKELFEISQYYEKLFKEKRPQFSWDILLFEIYDDEGKSIFIGITLAKYKIWKDAVIYKSRNLEDFKNRTEGSLIMIIDAYEKQNFINQEKIEVKD